MSTPNSTPTTIDFHSWSLEALRTLLAQVQTEIAARETAPIPKQLWTHPCQDASRHHLGKYKHWAKLLTGVDTTKTNGYAWEGRFLSVGAEHLLPAGSIVVYACGENLSAEAIRRDADPQPLGSATVHSQYGLITAIAPRFAPQPGAHTPETTDALASTPTDATS